MNKTLIILTATVLLIPCLVGAQHYQSGAAESADILKASLPELKERLSLQAEFAKELSRNNQLCESDLNSYEAMLKEYQKQGIGLAFTSLAVCYESMIGKSTDIQDETISLIRSTLQAGFESTEGLDRMQVGWTMISLSNRFNKSEREDIQAGITAASNDPDQFYYHSVRAKSSLWSKLKLSKFGRMLYPG